jgi:hypothetical protein
MVIRKEDRLPPGDVEWSLYNSILKAGYSKPDALRKMAWTTIVLTVAHLDQDKGNNRFSNLAALCQRCHLNHDRSRNIEKRKYGRNWREIHFAITF